jgi:hypothetical protein
VTGQHSNQLNYQPIGPKKQAYAIFRIAKIGILIFYKQNFIKIIVTTTFTNYITLLKV